MSSMGPSSAHRDLIRTSERISPLVKSYDFTRWLVEHTLKFPKSQRFVMVKRAAAALSLHTTYCCSR